MRLILYMMVLCNLLTFAWFGYQESISNPEKIEVHAIPEGVDALRLLSEQESLRDFSVYEHNQPQTVGICHTFGPLESHDLALDLLAEIEELGRVGSIRSDKQKVQYAYWVYLESMSVEELEKVILTLEENGIKDYRRTDRNELSLGIYNGVNHAKRRQTTIAALGLSPLMGPLYRAENIYWIDVTDMHFRFHTDHEWESYLTRYPDSQHKSSTCELTNV